MEARTMKRLVDAPPARLRGALKNLAVSCCRLLNSSKTFQFQGRDYHYFFHQYNLAWRNERVVEIPIILAFLASRHGQETLEVGNVLSHYVPIGHDILDKYEAAEGVINEDAVEFDPGKKYDLIVSISTLEHIGWDEAPRDPGKLSAALKNLAGLLAPEGELVATVPLGLNPEFDRLLEQEITPFDEIHAMRRIGGNKWVEADFESVRGAHYARNRFRADAIIVGLIRKGRSESAGDRDSI